MNEIIQGQLSQKLKDPRAPLISCNIGVATFDYNKLDLGANINLIPMTIYEQFKMGELKPTHISLQLVD